MGDTRKNHDDDLIWKALSDRTRREILDLLQESPKTTGQVAAEFAMSRFGVMKHLSILEEAKLIVIKRDGRERWNHLNPIPIQQIYERWMTKYQAQWAGRLLNIKDLIEKESKE